MKVAVVSPNKNAFSETFIKAHKRMLNGQIHYLYGGFYPQFSEKEGSLKKRRDIFYKWMSIFIKNVGLVFQFDQNGFKRYLKKQKIDLVLAEYGPTGAETVAICEELKISLITHFHGADAYKKEIIEKYFEKYKKVFLYSSYIIAVSKDMVEQLVKLGADREKIIYNPCGADESFLDISPDYNSDHCFFVGRFCDKKAPYFVLMAFQKAIKKNNSLRLTMAGDGELREACMNMAEHFGISDKVCFPGVVTPEQIKEYMKNSFCYVQHSITSMTGDSEGTPVGITEASAAGLPVVATRHAGIKDVIIDGETGILVDEKDVAGMAEGILKLAGDREFCKIMGEKGKKFISEGYTAQQRVEILNNLIKNLLKK